MGKRILSIIASLMLCVALTPTVAFADDVTTTVTVLANKTNGNATKATGKVTVTQKSQASDFSAYGVYAKAVDGKTATASVGDISVKVPKADWQYGVYAYAGDSDNKTGGHAQLITGSISSQNHGIEAHSVAGGDTTVVVKGNINAGAYNGFFGSGVQAFAQDGATTKITVKGNIKSIGDGIKIGAVKDKSHNTGTVSIEINGDVTSSAEKGIEFDGQTSTSDVLVTGTISGNKRGINSDTFNYSSSGNSKLTVWKIISSSGNLVTKTTSQSTFVADDDFAKEINYIVKYADNVIPRTSDGSKLATSHGYSVAKEGDIVLVTAANGNYVKKAYNNGVEITTKDDEGNYYVKVKRGGGINITAEIGSTPATKTASVPEGQSLVYNGEAQTGVEAGKGYTLSGTTSATNAGTYKATATLDDGYTWSDGTTAPKEITWTISSDPDIAKVSMFRLYNPNSGEHFYTSAQGEHDNLVSVGWNDEGTGWITPETSNTPVYRLYNANGGEHHYTMDASERDMLIEAGWNGEGVGWYSDDAQGQALFREYNPNAFSNNHNYTTDASEHGYLVSIGWNDEGYAWYGLAAE